MKILMYVSDSDTVVNDNADSGENYYNNDN